jgi:SAM-dependent methyltransferase
MTSMTDHDPACTTATAAPAATSAAAVEAFGARLTQALNEAGVLLMSSIGHRLGIFDAMADGKPVTSAALAERAGLEERYVREWLGSMTAGRIVDMDAVAATYHLPAEHAALLTRGGEANMAVYAQYIPLLGSMEEEILRCFRAGGGVPYERFHRFHEVMAEDSGQTVLPVLFDSILPLAPDLPGRLEEGIRVLDAGCGRGHALALMAERYPASEFVGYDLSQEAVKYGADLAAERGLSNLHFEARDLSDFDRAAEPAAFDLVTTFDAIHDQAHPLALLRGIRRTLKPGGVYLAQDIHASSHHHLDSDHPMGAMLYAVSTMHCMTVSLAQGGEGLGTMWGREKAREYFDKAGFSTIEVHQLPHDNMNDYWVIRP